MDENSFYGFCKVQLTLEPVHFIFCANFTIRACVEKAHRHVGNIIQARRFITLVDELYNHHCRLICTADGPPDDLFLGTMDGAIFDLERLVILKPYTNVEVTYYIMC